MTAAKPRRSWWPFWVVIGLYLIVRPMFIDAWPSPVTIIVALLDPVTLAGAIALGLTARVCVPAKRVPV